MLGDWYLLGCEVVAMKGTKAMYGDCGSISASEVLVLVIDQSA